jgi:hypothetical protein
MLNTHDELNRELDPRLAQGEDVASIIASLMHRIGGSMRPAWLTWLRSQRGYENAA